VVGLHLCGLARTNTRTSSGSLGCSDLHEADISVNNEGYIEKLTPNFVTRWQQMLRICFLYMVN